MSLHLQMHRHIPEEQLLVAFIDILLVRNVC